MRVGYANNKLAKMCSTEKERQKAFNELAKKVKLRLSQLDAVGTLADMSKIPAAKCHPLDGNLGGEFAVQLNGNYRLVFRPNHDPLPLLEDGGIDLDKITEVVVTQVGDYH
jgi:plasmid maintenance system killer protein